MRHLQYFLETTRAPGAYLLADMNSGRGPSGAYNRFFTIAVLDNPETATFPRLSSAHAAFLNDRDLCKPVADSEVPDHVRTILEREMLISKP